MYWGDIGLFSLILITSDEIGIIVPSFHRWEERGADKLNYLTRPHSKYVVGLTFKSRQ